MGSYFNAMRTQRSRGQPVGMGDDSLRDLGDRKRAPERPVDCSRRQARGTYLVSLSSCSSSCAILASRAAMEALYLDLTVPSISCSLTLSSLFCRSSCCRAFSFFWAWLRSRFRSVLIWSICGKEGW